MEKEQVKLVKKLRKQRDKLIAQKDWSGALAIYDRLIEIKPTVKRYCNRGFVSLKQGGLHEALQDYQKALELDPESELAQKGVYKTKAMLKNITKSVAEEAPTLLKEEKESPEASVKQLRQKVNESIKGKNWLDALSAYNGLIAIKATATRFSGRGYVLYKLSRLPESLKSYQKALNLNPQLEDARKGIATVKSLIHNIDQATSEEPVLGKHFEQVKKKQQIARLVEVFVCSLAFILVAGIAYISFATNPDKVEFEQAEQKNTILAYEMYLKKFPQGKFVKDIEFLIFKKKLADQIFFALETEKKKQYDKALKYYKKALKYISDYHIYREKLDEVAYESSLEKYLLEAQKLLNKTSIIGHKINKLTDHVLAQRLDRAVYREKESMNESALFYYRETAKNLLFLKQSLSKEKYEKRIKRIIQFSSNKNILFYRPIDNIEKKINFLSHKIFEKKQRAKGLVKYKGTWMTNTQRHEKKQRARGLVKYKGAWMTKTQRYDKKQRSRGLVKYKGTWMKPAEARSRKEKAKLLAKKRELAEEARRLEEERERQRQAEIRLQEEQFRLAEEKKKQQQEAVRLAKEAKRKQEEALRLAAEKKKLEEEKKRQEENQLRLAQEKKRQEEEKKKQQEEQLRLAQEKKKLEEEKRAERTIAFINPSGYLQISTDGQETTIEYSTPKSHKITKGTLAYIAYNGYLKSYIRGQGATIEYSTPKSYKVAKNTIVYIAYNGYFKARYKGRETTIEYSAPKSYKVAQGTVAYIAYNGYFKARYKGRETTIAYSAPKSYKVAKGFVTYVDSSNNYYQKDLE